VHIRDGFLDAPVSVGTGVIAVAGLAYCVKRAQTELDDKLAPMAGLTAAFVFGGLGGNADLPITGVLAAMTGVHLLIGIGEGVITALTVGAVLKTRPDLVHGARRTLVRPELVLRETAAR